MDSLIRQTIELLKQESAKTPFVLATPEEFNYFSPSKVMKDKKPSNALDPEMQQLISKVLPEVRLTSAIPDDAIGKKMSQLYQEPQQAAKVLILSCGETGPNLQFLQNVTEAINTLLIPARLIEMRKIERENSWELTLHASLQLILAPPLHAWKSLQLARFYRENPTSSAHSLQNIPLLMLQPVSAYLKNPDLKRELWKNLSTRLSTLT